MDPGQRSLGRPVSHWKTLLFGALVLAACACSREPTATVADAASPVETATSGDSNGSFGAVSVDEPATTEPRVDIKATTDWPAASLESGTAVIRCDAGEENSMHDRNGVEERASAEPDADDGDVAEPDKGRALVNLEFFSVLDVLSPCQQSGVMKLTYDGKIAADFFALMERVSAMADRMEIGKRILDINSSGGQVEYAMRAGDVIGESGWTIWVREQSMCHSSCVLVLAAGDNRLISGKVGVHRIIRLQSDATSRAELNQEVREVHANIEQYLSRNGVAVAIADLMMTVPNRSLRLLTQDELQQYGMLGINAAQDDLDRIRLVRKCGEDFVQRRDSFFRNFDRKCAAREQDVEAMNTCGLALREQFGFPDRKCRTDSPLSEFDNRSRATTGDAPAEAETQTLG